MKKISPATVILCAALCIPCGSAKCQSRITTLLKNINGKGKTTTKTVTTTTTTTATSLSSAPTSAEIGLGLKDALELSISRGADQLSAKDGYLGNAAVKILFPPEAQKVERTLRSVGLGALADNVITSMNRAAESAAKEAKPIFVAAIKQMTITDASAILLGSDHAATDYFKRVTTAQLTEKFKPVISANLENSGAARYWGEASARYNKLPLVNPVSTDLSAYATQKAIEGMFIQVAQEETGIRNNLSARPTSLIQKVFGYADQKK